MPFFRNPEIKRSLLLFFILTMLFTGTAFYMGTQTGVFVALTCIVLNSLYLALAYWQYNKIKYIHQSIDNILHGQEVPSFDTFREGELAILQNEISKLVDRLKEQAETLKLDKIYLSDSLADISHQLRTPLTSINLIVPILRSENLSSEKRIALSKELSQLLSRIDWLIASLLKMSKIDAGTAYFKSAPISVQELVQKAVEPLAIMMELQEQQFQVQIENAAAFTGDFAWSAEAIGNILKNCMEHTPKGGSITVKGIENAVFTEITITDTGQGIAKEDLPRLFERFYRGKHAKNSSVGIGLALSRMIITKQNGIIKAENLESGGAKFTIRFYKSII